MSEEIKEQEEKIDQAILDKHKEAEEKIQLLKNDTGMIPTFEDWVKQAKRLNELTILSRKVSRVVDFSIVLTNIDILRELKGLREDIQGLTEALKTEPENISKVRIRGK